MKKIANVDSKLASINPEESDKDAPSIRTIFRLIGNVKAESADDSRRVRRIITKLAIKTDTDLVLEIDDIAYITRVFEKNPMNLTGWMQGQILDIIEGAERVDMVKKD